MREPVLLRWVLPGAVLGWGVARWLCIESSVSLIVALTTASAVVLLRFSDVFRAVVAAISLGMAVGLVAGLCVPLEPDDWSPSMPDVMRFELTQPWSAHGDVRRWVALNGLGQQVLLEVKGKEFNVGQTIVAGVQRSLPKKPEHAADFNEAAFLRSRGVIAKYAVQWCGNPADASGASAECRRALARMKRRVVKRCLSIENEGVAGFVLALSTGDKRGISKPCRTAFSDAGLSHLVAVSGFHIGLVAGMVLFMLRVLHCPQTWRPFVFLPSVWGYVGICGWPNSAVRAAAMMSVAALAMAAGRKTDGVTVLSAVGLAMVAWSPEALGDLGVGLSFLATAGILLLHRYLMDRKMPGWGRFVWMLFGVPIVAVGCTAPLSWPAFGKLPLLFVATNVMATPLVTAIMALFVAWCLLPHPLSRCAEEALVQMTELFLKLVNGAAQVQPLLMPLDNMLTAAAGFAVALGMFVGLAVKRPMWFVLGGVFTALAMLRWSEHAALRPEVLDFDSGCVVYGQGRAAVFTDAPQQTRRSDLKWKTRSFVERVSHDPPDSIKWCGTHWAMSPYHIRCRTEEGDWRLVSSPQ